MDKHTILDIDQEKALGGKGGEGDHRLVFVDCVQGMALLPDLSIDVSISDAPYSEHVHTRSRRGSIEHEHGTVRAAFSRNKDLGFTHLTDELRTACAKAWARLVRRWVLVFSDTESAHLWRESLEDAGLEYVRTLFWRKIGCTPQFTGDRPGVACEAITVAQQPQDEDAGGAIVLAHRSGRKLWNGGGKAGFYDVPIALDRGGSGPRIHSTQKPERLMEMLVEDFTLPGELVLDSFAGAATTLVSCKRLGRRAIGFEQGWGELTDEEKETLNEAQQKARLAALPRENFDLAAARLANAREQYEIRGARPPKPRQSPLFEKQKQITPDPTVGGQNE